jgi:hypothetical protein
MVIERIFAARTIMTSLLVKWTPSRPKGVRSMLRKTMIVLATAAALTGGLIVDAFAHRGHAGGFGGGGGHSGGFGGGHFGGGHFGGAEIGRGFSRGFAGSHFAGRHSNFGRERGFDRDRGFDHRRFGRGFGFVPSWDYGLYDYGCSYGYPTYDGYSCNLSPAY